MKVIIEQNGIYTKAEGEACAGKSHGSVKFCTNDGTEYQAMIGMSSFAPNCYLVQAYKGSARLTSFSIELELPFEAAAMVIAGIAFRESFNEKSTADWIAPFNLTFTPKPR